MKRKLALVTPIIVILLIFPAIAVGIEDRTIAPLNDGGRAEDVLITIKKSDFFSTILRSSVFFVEIWSRNDITINYYLDINVISRNGEVLFEHKHDLMPPLEPKVLWSWGCWYYPHFRQIGFLFGFFDINVKIQVLEDASIKTQTAHGFIFGISAIIWD